MIFFEVRDEKKIVITCHVGSSWSLLVKVIVVVVVNATGFTLFLCQSKNAEKRINCFLHSKMRKSAIYFFRKNWDKFFALLCKVVDVDVKYRGRWGEGSSKKARIQILTCG